MLRAVVTGGFLILAGVILWISFWLGPDTARGNLLINLGSEIVGIVLTVAIVEWFFERRRLQTRALQVASDTLHAVGHVVWVWQGGPRETDTDEVLAILEGVGKDDPLPEFTEGLMLAIGTRSRRLLGADQAALAARQGVRAGLEHLSRLSSIRDAGTSMPPRKVAAILRDGTQALAEALYRPADSLLPSLIRHRDPSVEKQERRHFGVTGGQVARYGIRWADAEE